MTQRPACPILPGLPLSLASLVNGQIVQPGTYHLVGASDVFLAALEGVQVPANGYAPDSMITVGGLSLRCTSDNSANCNIVLHDDGSFTTMGTIATVLAGGQFPMTVAERLIAAERARAEAEKARADAAEAAQEQEQAAREEAEREAAEAAARASTGDARRAILGLRSTTAVGTVEVTPKTRGARRRRGHADRRQCRELRQQVAEFRERLVRDDAIELGLHPQRRSRRLLQSRTGRPVSC